MSVKLNSLLPLRTNQKYFSTVQIKYYKCTRNLFVKTKDYHRKLFTSNV